jgi:hypothetical protein
MNSPAERDSFERWRNLVIVVTLLLLVAQTLLMGPAQGKSFSWALMGDILAAVIPNFIAGLIAALAVYFVVRTDDRANYVRAMRSLRTSVSTLLDSGKIKAEDVQLGDTSNSNRRPTTACTRPRIARPSSARRRACSVVCAAGDAGR